MTASTVEAWERVASLDEAIEQQMHGLGVRVAEEALAAVVRLYGEDQVRAWAADLFLEVGHWRAAQIEGRYRRTHERERERQPDEAGIVVAYLRDPVRVPVYEAGKLTDFEVVPRGEMAEAQHLAVIRYREGQMRAMQRGVDLHERDLWLIRHHQVSCLNELPPDAMVAALEEAA